MSCICCNRRVRPVEVRTLRGGGPEVRTFRGGGPVFLTPTRHPHVCTCRSLYRCVLLWCRTVSSRPTTAAATVAAEPSAETGTHPSQDEGGGDRI